MAKYLKFREELTNKRKLFQYKVYTFILCMIATYLNMKKSTLCKKIAPSKMLTTE